MSLQTGARVAIAKEPIIDPRRLHIVALYCEGPLLDSEAAVLYTGDIREVSDIGLIVDDSDVIMDPRQLVRLQEVIDFDFHLMHLPVLTEHGKHLGKVSDYTVDTLTFLIHKIHVRRPLLRSLSVAELIIDRQQIIEVTNQHIIVRSATVTTEARSKSTAFANPFRTPSPQPDTIDGERRSSS